MRVEVGPVPASSAQAFVDYARTVLASSQEVAPDAAARFRAYLDEWEELADTQDPLVWRTDVSGEEGEYLVYAFYRLAQRLDEQTGASDPAGPEEGEAFYWTLVEGLLDALDADGAGSSEFAGHLRSFWPGRAAGDS